ncbi:TPA: phosphoribosyl-AMP cyclohydrolase [Candidatus Bathyarchaeota archaeon]|nr:phosphoribosyl-AMP cyclohydrolase [Candidatus Bathyarchaeota archaeon]
MKFRRLVSIDELDFKKGKGLVPVVVQDYKSRRVLTLAYADREALEMTVKTGYAYFFRRSFGHVMKKGETSGNVQKVMEILVDCDVDAVLYLVEPKGPACHLGKETCFHNRLKDYAERKK